MDKTNSVAKIFAMIAKPRCLTHMKLSAMSSLNDVPEKRERMFSPECMMKPLPVAVSLQPDGYSSTIEMKRTQLPVTTQTSTAST